MRTSTSCESTPFLASFLPFPSRASPPPPLFADDVPGLGSFEERAKDVLKVSGQQVSPTEIENVLLAYPDKLVSDVTVAGVSGGRTSDEKVPRAWVVLSEEGRRRGEAVVAEALNGWIQKNLSKFKWLRGGIEVVDEVRSPQCFVIEILTVVTYTGIVDPEEPYWQGSASCTAGAL